MSFRPVAIPAISAALAGIGGCSAPVDRSPPVASVDLATTCIDVGLAACRTEQGGHFTVEGRTLFWQLQTGEVGDKTGEAAYVLADRAPNGSWRVVASAKDGFRYDAPQLIWMDGMPHLVIVGWERGNGNYNADAIWRWTGAAAEPLTKVQGWPSGGTVSVRPGLSVRKGVLFRYADDAITADTALWRDPDGDCCPTGGEARLVFTIRDDRLLLTAVEIAAPPTT